jgi:hypothetical protein
MAEGAITITRLTTVNSTKTVKLTFTAIDTATGAYLDVTGYKTDRIIYVLKRRATDDWTTASTAALVGTTKALLAIVKGSTIIKLSGYGIGGYALGNSAATAANQVYSYFGPFEGARFQDSNERIHFKPTTGAGSTCPASIAAILI